MPGNHQRDHERFDLVNEEQPGGSHLEVIGAGLWAIHRPSLTGT